MSGTPLPSPLSMPTALSGDFPGETAAPSAQLICQNGQYNGFFASGMLLALNEAE
jgi:hypothetical protein